MQDLIQINKLSKLHDGKKIIFCKTDYTIENFNHIESLSNDVIFITGNSDLSISDELVALAPKNIKKWFCQNRSSDHPLLESIPIGVENTIPCKREGHGYVWDHAHEKIRLLSSPPSHPEPTKLLYSNFTSFPAHRISVRDISQKQDHITWTDPSLSYSQYVNDILSHKMTVCPEGNGVDCHRTWEVLHLGRVPIVKKSRALQDFETLPIVALDSWDDLEDLDLINFKYTAVKDNSLDMLDSNYWLEKIYDESILEIDGDTSAAKAKWEKEHVPRAAELEKSEKNEPGFLAYRFARWSQRANRPRRLEPPWPVTFPFLALIAKARKKKDDDDRNKTGI